MKKLIEFNWCRDEQGIVVGQITANSFGYNMVRNLVGAAVCVGEGRFEPAWMKKTLEGRVRISDSYVFPAKGLSLIKVDFPPADQYLANYNDYHHLQQGQENEGDF